MPEVVLAVASNQDRENNIRFALTALRTSFGKIAASPIYESRAQEPSTTSFDYYNLVVSFSTSDKLDQVQKSCKLLEKQAKRTKTIITLDIDVLLYGDKIAHPDILNCAYVLRPLSELLPEHIHPIEKKNYRTLWQHMVMTLPTITLNPIHTPLIKIP